MLIVEVIVNRIELLGSCTDHIVFNTELIVCSIDSERPV